MSTEDSGEDFEEVEAVESPRRWLQGRNWYRRLVESQNGLYKKFPPRRWLPEQVLVQLMHGENGRYFSLFDDYIALCRYIEGLAPGERTMNEILPSEKRRKPYFDLDAKDVPRDGETEDRAYARNRARVMLATSLLVRALSFEIPDLSLERDVLVCESERAGGKASVHVVINHWFHSSKHESHALYLACVERIRDNFSAWTLEYASATGIDASGWDVEGIVNIIDHSVYSGNQNFRLLWCQKPGKGNFKRVSERWDYFGREIVHEYSIPVRDENRLIIQLSETLISFIGECRALPTRVLDEDARRRENARRRGVEAVDEDGNVTFRPRLPLEMDTVRDAMHLLQTYLGVKNVRSAFAIRETECFEDHEDGIPSGMIMLDRNMPTHCPLCQRSHDYENPFITIRKGDVYYSCRRSRENKSDKFKEHKIGNIALSAKSPFRASEKARNENAPRAAREVYEPVIKATNERALIHLVNKKANNPVKVVQRRANVSNYINI